MGMYTTVDAEIIVKQEALPLVKRLTTERRHWRNEGETWDTYEWWADLVVDFPWLKEWSEYSRAGFIPFGGCPGHENKLEGNVWSFKCELKNYDSTIEYFFEHILPQIADSIPFLETFYEEHDCPSTWELIDGKIVRTKEGGYSNDSPSYWG